MFVDRRTSFLHTFTSKTKDGFITSLKNVYDFYHAHGHRVNNFRSDSESLFVYGNIPEFLESRGINQNFSLPYAHHQNLVERHVQTVVKTTSCLMHDQTLLGPSFWDYCLFHTVSLKNATPNSKTDGITPTQMVLNKPPIDLNRVFQFPFGSPVLIACPKIEKGWRFDLRNNLGIYLGNVDGSVNGGLVYEPSKDSVSVRSNLTLLSITEKEFQRYATIRSDILDKDTLTNNRLSISVPETVPMDRDNKDISDNESNDPPTNNIIIEESVTSENIGFKTLNNQEKHPPNRKTRRLIDKHMKKILGKRKIKKTVSNVVTRSKTRAAALIARAFQVRVDELSSALSGDEKEHWTQALKVEINSLLNVTSTIVPETPEPNKDYDVIYTTTVLKKKMKDIDIVDKYKVRICGCGNQLNNKTDYSNPTYSPTVNMLVHSTMLQLSILDRMHTASFDTVAAYLYQCYPEHLKPLYLKLQKSVALACGLDPNQLYRVKKYLYGLPDAGRAYYLAYSKHLKQHGYNKSSSDPCLFYRCDSETNMRTYIWFHVDDTFISSTHPEEITRFHDVLQQKFQVTSDYDIAAHLGISLDKLPDGSIKLRQSKLLDQIFKEYPTTIGSMYPMKVNRDRKNLVRLSDPTEYLRLLGKLMYITHSRPDVLTALSYAATKSKCPSKNDFNELLQIVSYLKSTENYGLTLYPNQVDGDTGIKMTCYVDASYLSHEDGRSHTGFIIGLSASSSTPASFFHSKSTKQKLVATSSTHEEMRALYELTTSIIFITYLMNEINRPIDLPVVIFEDNQPVVDLVEDLASGTKRSKHFMMLTNFVREQVDQGLMKLLKVDTKKNLANVLTKIITGQEFTDSFCKIMGASSN